MRDNPSRRVILTAAATMALGACGSPPPSRTQGKRVIALGYIKDADAALAAGITPVAMPKPSGLKTPEPWTAAALGSIQPEYLDVTADIPAERIAALRPDLILATGLYAIDRHRDILSRIAPVVAPVSGPNIDRWQDTAVRIGRTLGRESEAARQIAETERSVRQSRTHHPQLAGRTFTYSSYSGTGGFWTKNSAEDVIAVQLAEYGMSLPSAVTRLPPSVTQGMSQVSAERLDVLEADLIIVFFASDDDRRRCEANPLFAGLRGSYVPVGPVDGHALAFPSVLSVRYAAANVIPRLATAVKSR